MMLENCRFMSCRDLYENNGGVYAVASNYIIVFPSYLALLTLRYGNRMEKSWVAHCWAEEEGLSIREAERVIESEMFLDEYPQWELGTPHQTVILHEMFLHAAEWGWKEAECMCHWGHQSHILEPDPEADQSAMELVGYQMSRREMQDIHHSMYLLQRCPGSSSCGALTRRRAIQDILSSLQTQLQRQTSSAKTEGPGAHGRERVGTEPSQSYEGVLWAAHQKAVETAKALHSDLERLDDEHRGRSPVCSQNRSHHRTRSGSCSRTQLGSHPREQSRDQSRDQSRGWVRTCSESHPHADHRCMWSQSLDKPQNRRVSFCDPEDEDLVMEEQNPSAKPFINDLETWLDYQVRQLGTPMWWGGELEAIPGIADLCKFAQKIRALFYILEVRSRMCPEERYSAPHSLNPGAYLPDKLAYQDIRQHPALLTIAYCRCLQHWVEKCNLPRNPDFCPLAESVRELRQAICKFVDITREDVIKGLEMEEPKGGHQLSPTTIFSHVLNPPTNRQEVEESSTRTRNRAIECAPPTLRLEQEDHFVLAVTSSMSWLTIGPGDKNIERGRNLLWNHQRAAIFLPCHPALSIEEGATSMAPNIFSTGPVIEDITDRE